MKLLSNIFFRWRKAKEGAAFRAVASTGDIRWLPARLGVPLNVPSYLAALLGQVLQVIDDPSEDDVLAFMAFIVRRQPGVLIVSSKVLSVLRHHSCGQRIVRPQYLAHAIDRLHDETRLIMPISLAYGWQTDVMVPIYTLGLPIGSPEREQALSRSPYYFAGVFNPEGT